MTDDVRKITPTEVWKHRRTGALYEIIAVGRLHHVHDGVLVEYRPIDGKPVVGGAEAYARPVEAFQLRCEFHALRTDPIDPYAALTKRIEALERKLSNALPQIADASRMVREHTPIGPSRPTWLSPEEREARVKKIEADLVRDGVPPFPDFDPITKP